MSISNVLSRDEFEQLLTSAKRRGAQRIAELQHLTRLNRVYLFGYGGKGRMLARQIKNASNMDVIVYDSNHHARDLAAREGFSTVDAIQDIDQGECGIILGACQAQLEQAALIGHGHIFYQEAAYLFDTPHLSSKARDFSTWTIENIESLYEIYRSIHIQSKETFASVLSFRLSLDPHDLLHCKRVNSDMWFDIPETCSKRHYATFLDVGAYDGDTLAQAQRRLSVQRGIAVEANSSLFGSIERVAESYDNGVLILPRAAWSHDCRLKLSEVRGGMVSVSESDDGELEAGPIDVGISERIDLIKMDIEGSELSALAGCRETLRTGPDLAIAAYHRPNDFVQLPNFLAGVGYVPPDFEFHVAHYSDCFDDTIFYFLKTGAGR